MLGRLWRLDTVYSARHRRGVGDRCEIPAEPNEKIVVKNDGGVRNETATFAFGEVCYSSDHLETKPLSVLNTMARSNAPLRKPCVTPEQSRVWATGRQLDSFVKDLPDPGMASSSSLRFPAI